MICICNAAYPLDFPPPQHHNWKPQSNHKPVCLHTCLGVICCWNGCLRVSEDECASVPISKTEAVKARRLTEQLML